MKERVYRFTIFLMKEHVKDFDECIKSDAQVESRKLKESVEVDGVIVFAKSSPRKPEWINFLRYYCEEDIPISENVSNKAVFLIRVRDRIMALTYGFGRVFLREECIEKNFGFMSAINMLDDKQIRSINAATIEDMVVHTQKQTSYATGQDEFSLNATNDIMTSIAGKSKSKKWAKSVSGKDSLLVSVEMFPDDLKEKLEYYLTAYESDAYKKKGFGWIDNVREVRDIELRDILENLVLEKLRNKDLDNIYLSPPEIIDWNSISGFMICGMGKAKDDLSNYKEELNLEEYVKCLEGVATLKEKVKRDQIQVLNNNDNTYPIGSVYSALVTQIEYDGNLYILCNSCFYKIEDNFYSQVRTFVSSIPISDIDFPNCKNGEKEGEYNEKVCQQEGFAYLDKKLVGVERGPRKIEASDIFTSEKQFIHVKNRASSAQLSHLFAQGRVSATCFNEDEEYRKQVYDNVKEKLGKDIFDYHQKPKAEEYEVVYAIIAKNVGPIEDNLPFFSLVNLMLAVQELYRMHIKCSIKMIKKES